MRKENSATGVLATKIVAIKVKIPRGKFMAPAASQRAAIIRIAVASLIVLCLLGFAGFAYLYVKYDRIIDKRMKGQIFSNSAKIFSRPRIVRPDDKISREQVETELRRAGYIEEENGNPEGGLGTFREIKGAVEVHPGPESFHSEDGATIYFSGNKIDRVIGGGSAAGQPLAGYELEPELLTALFAGDNRTKRQIVKFEDIPKTMVDAVTSIEDRRFFQHSGVNYFRLAKAALIDIRSGEKGQGGSTLTMQMARAFFLNRQKSFKRKLLEMLIAIELEQKFTKQQIFELYANQVDMGQRGSYSIAGFAEASRAYFGKDLKNVTLPEAALLAGIVQAPSKLSPYRHPDHALERRNLVLDAMVETGSITAAEASTAKATPLKLSAPNVEASDAPYFVDLVKDTLTSRYKDSDINENAYRIYTTIDPELQHAAAEAVEIGIKGIDDQVKKQRTRKKKAAKGQPAEIEEIKGPIPQIALIAIDPHTGEVLALVGGRNYGFSQLNHAVAKRPTGSIFKPFVYAAAVNTAITNEGGSTLQTTSAPPNPTPGATDPNAAIVPTSVSAPQVFTPATLIDDSPTTFTYDNGNQIYEPRNFGNKYRGVVTAGYALEWSLNNATVKLAEMVGYDKVADLARAAGINNVKATPAAALGAYDASPLEMSGAWTVFANNGTRVDPMMIKSVRDSKGDVVEDFKNDSKPVLDPRVAYVITRMLEPVINHGTGYAVRARGFNAPAAGKTGTSHDAWFAGYTTNLLCIVWVGYDDYSDLKLEGGTTAAPVWAEFMKRAVALPEYHDAKEFAQPSGVIDVSLDKASNLLSTSACPDAYSAAFISGTEPTQNCESGKPNFFQRVLGLGNNQAPPAIINGPAHPATPGHPAPGTNAGVQSQPPAAPPQQEQKKGFWGKVVGVFKGEEKKPEPQKTEPPKPH
jgi:penicillin-binding protein 1B